MYSFLHPAVCGPVNIVANNSGLNLKHKYMKLS